MIAYDENGDIRPDVGNQGSESAVKPPEPVTDVPDWVPSAVRSHVLNRMDVYRTLGWEHYGPNPDPTHLEILRRLLTRPRMKKVWKELRRRRATADQLVGFFMAAYSAAAVPSLVVTENERADIVAEWLSAAGKCRQAGEQMAGERLERLARSMAPVGNPLRGADNRVRAPLPGELLMVVKHTRNDTARAYVRDLSDATRHLFGSALVRTVATTASVALDRTVTEHQVRNWCKAR
jgi:hypothetical protein